MASEHTLQRFSVNAEGFGKSDRDRDDVNPVRSQYRLARDFGASYSRLPAFHLMRPPILPTYEGHLAPGGSSSFDDRHRLNYRRLSGRSPHDLINPLQD